MLLLVPIISAKAAQEHRLQALAPAVGLALSMTVTGLLSATSGTALGLDANVFQGIGGILMTAVGAALLPRTGATKALGISKLSPSLVYRGGKEVGLVGVKDPMRIRQRAASILR